MRGAGEGACHRAALSAADPAAVVSGGPRLLRLVENLVARHVDPKHQRLRPHNKALRERVLDLLPGSLETLLFLGYGHCTEEPGEEFLSLDPQRHSPEAAAAEGQWLRQLVLRKWQELQWSCPSCTLNNSAESTLCAVCEGPRPSWVEVPALPMAPSLPRPLPRTAEAASPPKGAAAPAPAIAEQTAELKDGTELAVAGGASGCAAVSAPVADSVKHGSAAPPREAPSIPPVPPPGPPSPAAGSAVTAAAVATDTVEQLRDLYDPSGKRVAILTSGSRGDIQPIVALALRMRKEGFQVLLLTNVNHVDFVSKFGLQVHGTRTSFEPGQGGGQHSPEHLSQLWSEHREIERFAPDLMVATILSFVSGTMLSTLFKVPLVRLSLQPRTLDQENEGYIAFLYHAIFEPELRVAKGAMGSLLGGELWPSKDAFCIDEWSPISPTLIAWPRELCKMPFGWERLTGFLTISGEQEDAQHHKSFGGTMRDDLERFLTEGDVAPVYVGWGSMVTNSPKSMACLAVRSLRKAGLRGIILGGWAKLNAQMLWGEPDEQDLVEFAARSVLFMESAHHETLFPRCSAIVHHGGAGTCAAALRSGTPSVVTPHAVDQPMNGKIIMDAGYGVVTEKLEQVGKDELGLALQKCAYDRKMQARCRELGVRLCAEDGPGRAVAAIQRFMGEEVTPGIWQRRLEERRSRRVWRGAAPPELTQDMAELRRNMLHHGKMPTDGGKAIGSSGGCEAAQLLEPSLLPMLVREVDAAEARCSLRLRLPDRKAVTVELNMDFTVMHVRAWLEHHHAASFNKAYHLMDTRSFPPRKLADLSATLETLGFATEAVACLECRPA